MKNELIIPEFTKSAFHCPHCGVYSNQLWSNMLANGCHSRALFNTVDFSELIDGFYISRCSHCKKYIFWHGDKMIYPDRISVEAPNNDLPEDIKGDYLEAAAILSKSPRGSAALLRLCIQKLCIYLGQKGKNLNDDIGKLVELGLPSDITKAMDILRITGDNAVHPGQIDLNDDPEIAKRLFRLVNFIAEKTITEPKELNSFYDEVMPSSAKDAIMKRDAKKK